MVMATISLNTMTLVHGRRPEAELLRGKKLKQSHSAAEPSCLSPESDVNRETKKIRLMVISFLVLPSAMAGRPSVFSYTQAAFPSPSLFFTIATANQIQGPASKLANGGGANLRSLRPFAPRTVFGTASQNCLALQNRQCSP